MWEIVLLVWGPSSLQRRSHGSKCRGGKKKNGGGSNSTKEAVCNSSWPTHTTSAQSQWWCSNLTDWAQRFVCLKPLTYFYSHCRSQSLYGMIAELMQLVYSNNSMKKKKKQKPNWPKERRLVCCITPIPDDIQNTCGTLICKRLNQSGSCITEYPGEKKQPWSNGCSRLLLKTLHLELFSEGS